MPAKLFIDRFNVLIIFVLFSLLIYFSYTLPFLMQSNSIGFNAHHWIIRHEITTGPSYSVGMATGEVNWDQKPHTEVYWDRPSSVSVWGYFITHVVWNRYIPTLYFLFAFMAIALKKESEGIARFLYSSILYLFLIILIPWIANYLWPPLVDYNFSMLSVTIPDKYGWVLKESMPENYALVSRLLLWFLLVVQTLYAALVTFAFFQEDPS